MSLVVGASRAANTAKCAGGAANEAIRPTGTLTNFTREWSMNRGVKANLLNISFVLLKYLL
jgi:hypothetical protein